MNTGLYSSTMTRDPNSRDHFVTPEYAVMPLLKYLPAHATVWECTDGNSTSGITSLLRKHGYTVIPNSPYRDFLENEMPASDMEKIDFIITNPPYNQKDAFIATCKYYADKYPHVGWAMLMPLTTLEGVYRGKLFDSMGTDFGCIFMNRRTEFTGGSVWFNCSWFCYKLLPQQMIFADIQKGAV